MDNLNNLIIVILLKNNSEIKCFYETKEGIEVINKSIPNKDACKFFNDLFIQLCHLNIRNYSIIDLDGYSTIIETDYIESLNNWINSLKQKLI